MGDLVEVADVKQEAKKRFRRFALPRELEVDSESVPKVRSTGIWQCWLLYCTVLQSVARLQTQR